MGSITHFVNKRLHQMPYGLRVVSKVLLTLAIILPILTIIFLLAHGNDSHFFINGKQITYAEFLRRGYILIIFIIGLYCGILVCGLIRASNWARPLSFLPFAASFILAFTRQQLPLAIAVSNYLSLILAMALLVWYLFFRQTVKDYFAGAQGPSLLE